MVDDVTGNYNENLWEWGRLENTPRSKDNIKNAVNKLYEMTWYGFIWFKARTGGGRS